MKKTFKTLLLFFSISLGFSQEETKDEIISLTDEGKTNTDAEEIAFTVIERVPIHANCNESLSNQALKKCMNN
ncbi:MAG: hypothetical protein QNK89_11660 [Lacinutrix sp.]|uniref:hypothetical protein n=1 Tax=Lacinutrix sp. TaxID=1937692 RepID=UPI0030953898